MQQTPGYRVGYALAATTLAALLVVIGLAAGGLAVERQRAPGAGAGSGGLRSRDEPALALTPTPLPQASSAPAATVYIVRTPEQERSLRAWLAQGPFGVPGGAPANAVVILAPSPEEAAFARAAVRQWRSPAGATPAVVEVPTSP
jgi:hypothetical protein